MSGIMARKVGMTRLFREDGRVVPVTVLEARPCPVVLVRTVERDGYEAVQIGYRAQKKNRLTRPQQGHLDKAGAPPVACLAEIPLPEGRDVKPGDFFEVSMFVPGEKVNVTGLSKGKGFQGVVKRHGFSGGDNAHGCKSKRVPGSIGQHTTPAEVARGKKMPGRDGSARTTIKNLEVIRVDPDNNLLVLKGAVPGSKNGYLLVRKQAGGVR
jgi:large subunit ribosomal protein L3